MTNTPINFKQERDFGDFFNATFSFISQEFKRLGTAILYFVVPFLLLAAIAMTIYSVKAQLLMQAVIQGETPNPFAMFTVMGSLSGYITAAMLLSLIASTMMMSTVYGYIKLYIQKGREGFSINDVWLEVTAYFWPFLGAAFVVGLVLLAGTALCVIPGIYLGVSLSIVFCIMIFEQKKFSVAFSRSIRLIKTNWWSTFGILLVAVIIVYLLVILISIPSMLLGFKSILSNMKEGGNPALNLPMGYYIASSITQLLTQVLMVIPIVITAFIYYSTVEKVEKPSLLDKIGQISGNE